MHRGQSALVLSFSSVFGLDTPSCNPKNISMILYHLISMLSNVNFDFDICFANDVAVDIFFYSVTYFTLFFSVTLHVNKYNTLTPYHTHFVKA